MQKLSDYVFESLANFGADTAFLMTGGGAMHLNDSLGQQTRLRYVCHHHEQAAAMAAEGYARITNRPAIVSVTTGPGGVNALNGVFGAFTDSIPMLVLSGQVKRQTCMATAGTHGLRQLGDQEVDIVRMAAGVTKYAAQVADPSDIRYHLERAWHLARSGRPGPTWLDIPIDVQSAKIDPAALRAYDPREDESDVTRLTAAQLAETCRAIVRRISAAQSPVIVAGTGVRLAGALELFTRLIRRLEIPVTTAWTHDLITGDDPLFCGRPGTIGTRAGNFTVQNADLVLVLGSRLNIRQVSYNWQSFASRAFKIQVDVDAAELHKPLVQPDLPVAADLADFLPALLQAAEEQNYRPHHQEWLGWCKQRVARYPVVQERQRHDRAPMNPYYFMELLDAQLREDDIVVCGNASACILPYQVMQIRRGQRLISNSGAASMGYDLPAAIGAAVAARGGRVVCLAGDGSLMLNLQELQTVAHYKLPIKLVVLNNNGYLSIRSTQQNFFGRLMGEGPATGVSFPDFQKVAAAFGLPACRIARASEMDQANQALTSDGPAVIEVMLDPEQGFEPRSRSRILPDGTIASPALEDMYPFLSAEELAENQWKRN